MRPFAYARPTTIGEVAALLDEHGSSAMLLAGGTDLIIGLRDGYLEPKVVVDVKRVADLPRGIHHSDDAVSISATAVMTDIEEDERLKLLFPALVEAASVVGSVQIRDRATIVGNICNGSPAADTAPPLLVHDAVVLVAGRSGTRRVPIDDFIVGPGKTDLGRGELVTAIELPLPPGPYGAAYRRLVRRRGTDLASITMCCGVDGAGVTRLAYGSVGPRAFLVVDESGVLADQHATDEAKAPVLQRMFAEASPSPTSMRAGPDYRLAMLPVLGARALRTAIERRGAG